MTEHAVVIVGGGPTGRMLVGELALAGVDVAIVERRPNQVLVGARAGGLHSRTIKVLDELALARACDVARAAQRRSALLTILTRRRLRRHPSTTFLTDLAAQDHRTPWRSPQAARAATQSPGRNGHASRFFTRLSMQRAYYASVGVILLQSGVQRHPYARGR